MDIMEQVYERAKANPQRVAFPEATNEKILAAARESVDKGLCLPILVGNSADVVAAATAAGIDIDGIELVDATDEAWLDALITEYVGLMPINSAKTMRRKSVDPFYIALMMQVCDRADITFAGIDHTTGDVIMGGQMVVGLQPGVSVVSSVGVFNIPGFEGSEGQLLGFGDSAVCVDPTSEDLAGIAIAACDTTASLVGWEPRCALLSYSTTGSGEGPLVDKVVEAVRIANERRPDLAIDGEFQFDSAINPKVAGKKVKRESRVAGKANIVIWPDLNVGNVAVKLVQQFGKADAYGPMLQGFAKIVCDCSRGAPVTEIIGNIAMSCVRAQGVK
jgi:phosphate acetyltransferase